MIDLLAAQLFILQKRGKKSFFRAMVQLVDQQLGFRFLGILSLKQGHADEIGLIPAQNTLVNKLFEDGICKVNIWTALERDASPALTEWIVKNAAKVGGPKTEQKLIEEGYLTESSKTGDKASLQHFTTAARQEIIFEEMKKITRGYLDLWYK